MIVSYCPVFINYLLHVYFMQPCICTLLVVLLAIFCSQLSKKSQMVLVKRPSKLSYWKSTLMLKNRRLLQHSLTRWEHWGSKHGAIGKKHSKAVIKWTIILVLSYMGGGPGDLAPVSAPRSLGSLLGGKALALFFLLALSFKTSCIPLCTLAWFQQAVRRPWPSPESCGSLLQVKREVSVRGRQGFHRGQSGVFWTFVEEDAERSWIHWGELRPEMGKCTVSLGAITDLVLLSRDFWLVSLDFGPPVLITR